MEEKEIWKDVVGFEKKYQVSNLGRVRSKQITYKSMNRTITKQGKIRKGFANANNGYVQYMLYDDNCKYNLRYAHRLVAEAFLPKPKNGETMVCHKDKDKTNNRASNLMWKFRSEQKNKEFGIEVPERYKPIKKKNRFRYIIKQKTLNGFVVAMFNGFEELEKQGFKKTSIMAAAKGKYAHNKDIYKNYKWECEKIKD